MRMPPTIRREVSATISTKPMQAKDGRPLLEVAEGYQRHRARDHDLGLLQRDDAEEESDAGGDRELEVLRDRVDDIFADAEHRQDEEQNAGAEHGGQGLLPAIFIGQHDCECEESIEPHAGRERDRIVGVERHHQRGHRRRDAGRHEHGTLVHAGIAQDRRVNEDDVDHSQKRGQAGNELGPHIGTVFGKPKCAVKKRSALRHGSCPPPPFPELVFLRTVNSKRSAINCRYVNLAVVTSFPCATRSARAATKLCKSACGGLSRRLCRTRSVFNVPWQTTGAR